MWTYLLLGLGLGILAVIPIAGVWSRRTERRVRQLEQRARANERLAELGTLTGGLAHEIKNPLSTIGLNMQLVREDLDDLVEATPDDAVPSEKVSRMRRRFEGLGRETKRLREILEDFLHFAGRVELSREPTDINHLVDELVVFYEPQAGQAKVHIRPALTANPSQALVDAALLKQALLNLMINATQAMTGARQREVDHGGADELLVRTEARKSFGEPQMLIHITDTGPGMSEEVQAKLFQPYYSTKQGGTGLGLPTARRIIEEHGGTLSVHTEPGRGTDFTITLPASESTAEDEAAA